MTGLHVSHHDAAAAFVAQLGTLVPVASALDDVQLCAASRCRGWLVCDALTGARSVRLMAAAYQRPTSVVTHLRPTADGLARAVRAAAPGAVRFQGHVLATGDFLASWAVELAVHHLDLARELDLPGPYPDALRMARQTIEAPAGDLPPAWPDETAVLAGTGRLALDESLREQAGPVAGRLPAFG